MQIIVIFQWGRTEGVAALADFTLTVGIFRQQ
jgi:hypothetical protein